MTDGEQLIDTNVLVHAYTVSDSEKHRAASTSAAGTKDRVRR